MDTLFILLIFVSLIALVIGLIKPSLFDKIFKGQANRKKIGLALGVTTVAFLILGAATSPTTPEKEVVVNKENPSDSIKFDVPSLIGKNMNEIVAILGTPNKDNSELTPAQLELGATEWSKSYEKDGRELLITYNIETGSVIDFFIPSTDKETENNDKKGLLAIGNLKENSQTYSIEFVKLISNPSKFTGVKITPNK